MTDTKPRLFYAEALASLASCQETFPDYHLYEMRRAGVVGVPAAGNNLVITPHTNGAAQPANDEAKP